ncbi:MAG: hypothetical protein ABR511_12890 [Acidimicrobiales bacterium]
MRKPILAVGLAAFAAASLTGITVAAANAVRTQPAPAVVSRDGRIGSAHDVGDDRGRDATTTVPAGGTTVTTVDDHGADDPATHEVGDDRGRDATTTVPAGGTTVDDHGADDPATHEVGDDHGDDHGADDPATHEVGDDHGAGTSGGSNRGPGGGGGSQSARGGSR